MKIMPVNNYKCNTCPNFKSVQVSPFVDVKAVENLIEKKIQKQEGLKKFADKIRYFTKNHINNMIYTSEQRPSKDEILLDGAIERLDQIVKFKDKVQYLAKNRINRVFYTSDPKLTEEEEIMSKNLRLVLMKRADLRKKLFDASMQDLLEKYLSKH